METALDLDALSAWMAGRVANFEGPLSARKFAVGQSNPTYLLESPSGSYVLRHKPFGNTLPSAHAVDREYKVMAALGGIGFPVPQPLALCEDPAVIGAIFYIMARVEGRNLIDGTLPGFDPQERAKVYEAMTDLLAQLHNVVPEQVGLGDYGPPGNFFERQVGRWTKQYRASQTRDISAFGRLIDWLPKTLPSPSGRTIVHGDFRIDNIIFAMQSPAPVALLDWELSTLGDPLADLSYFLMSWHRNPDGGAGTRGVDHTVLGIPSVEKTVERYCAATGRSDVPDLNWYFAFNFFRLGAICQGIAKRVADGNASNEKAVEAAAMAEPLADQAWIFAQLAGA